MAPALRVLGLLLIFAMLWAPAAAAAPARDVRTWTQHVVQAPDFNGEVPPTDFTVDVPHSHTHVAGESVLLVTFLYDAFGGIGAAAADMRLLLDGAQICRWVYVQDALEDHDMAGEVRCKTDAFLTGAHTVEIENQGNPDAIAQAFTTVLLQQTETVEIAASPLEQASLYGGLGALPLLGLLFALEFPRIVRRRLRDPEDGAAPGAV